MIIIICGIMCSVLVRGKNSTYALLMPKAFILDLNCFYLKFITNQLKIML